MRLQMLFVTVIAVVFQVDGFDYRDKESNKLFSNYFNRRGNDGNELLNGIRNGLTPLSSPPEYVPNAEFHPESRITLSGSEDELPIVQFTPDNKPLANLTTKRYVGPLQYFTLHNRPGTNGSGKATNKNEGGFKDDWAEETKRGWEDVGHFLSIRFKRTNKELDQ